MRGRVLIIAGSDSGGGAGIQGDIKTVSALGGYAMTAITALTAQNTRGVFGIHPVPEEFIAQQIELCLSDIGADAIKTGMLHSAAVIETVVATLDAALCSPPQGEGFPARRFEQKRLLPIPLVVDPVMVAKGGSPLLAKEALEVLKTQLIPRATIITPNLPEAELLLGHAIPEDRRMEDAAKELLDELGAQAVLLKGGHAQGDTLHDVLVMQNGESLTLSARRIDTMHTHGTGCALASAIATGLAKGLALAHAVTNAHTYVQHAIGRAPGFGKGHGPLGH